MNHAYGKQFYDYFINVFFKTKHMFYCCCFFYRLFALKVGVSLAAKLGEDYMPLLPETVPFISELLEDENPEVEKQCQLSVQELEKILGEPLQKYF